ncbi:LysR family transcriptional regulator [Microbulbifer taiwanensis]|uniref:LysR family transcriptional regulator n=1 Tax=Microbulbifer taiwanensis TaxID=986746 RepID=A0ABW1YJ84_9GAMM|nr:LysR family transcriptional regulator [Microbulbifer taiwanensis]
MLTLKQLRHLRAIVQHGTILRAAEVLHLTHPALTRSLNNLEETLGVQLFERSKAGMRPTPFCLQLARRCDQVLLDIDDIQREAELYRNVQTGTLNIGVGRAMKDLITRNTLPEFVESHPRVVVGVSEGTPEELVYRLKRRELDLLVAGSGSYRDIDGIRYQHLQDIPLSVIVNPAHPLRARADIRFDDLVPYPLIASTLVSAANPLYRAVLSAGDPNRQLPSLVCSDYSTLKDILLRTQSWLIAPEFYYSAEILGGELCTLDISHPALLSQLSVMDLGERSRSPAAAAFIALCEKNI